MTEPEFQLHDPVTAWTIQRKLIVSCLLLFHLCAVFAAPCAAPPPASFAWNWLAGRRENGRDGVLVPYLRAGYLNHGYRFFAPNPGPSHLVRFEIDLKSGGQIEGTFPDPEDQWPRLLYHRMFMISESVFNLESPVSEQPPEGMLSDEEQRDFDSQRALADELLKSIARRLLAEHDGERVRLFAQTHEIPFPTDVLAGQSLDAAELYSERALGEFVRDQL